MKPTILSTKRMILCFSLLGLSLALVSWDNGKTYTADAGKEINDTIPKSKEKKVRDLDEVFEELDQLDLEKTMEKVRLELAESLKQIDSDKIRLEIDKAMRDVDFGKISEELRNSLAKVDMSKIKIELGESLKQLEELKKIDMSGIEKEMSKLKLEMKDLGPELEKVKEQMKNLGPQMEKVKVEMEKVKENLKGFKAFVDDLEKDGLLNKEENYTIENKDGELTINGKKASVETNNKYKSFLEKHRNFTIKKADDSFNIDMD